MFISEKVKKLRKDRGWSMTELGKITGSSGTHIQQIENRKRTNISLMTLCRLGEAFGMGLDELVGGTEFDLKDKRQKK